jgi:hypothetical protein
VPRSGISYAPELEWRLAARWAGYKMEEFQALDGADQSDVVAAYRAQNQIDAVLAWENRPKAK